MNKTIFFIPFWFFIFLSCVSIQKKEDKNNLGNFPPQQMGVITAAAVKRGANELIPREYSVVLLPQVNKIRIHHKFMGDNIWIFLTEDDRKTLIEAISKYLKAYKTAALKHDAAAKASFGKIRAEMLWGVLNAAYSAKPDIRFEYQFITPDKPYFIIANATTPSKDGNNCPAMRCAFSPAQCKDLIGYLKQENIMQVVNALKEDYGRYEIDDDFEIDGGDAEEAEN